MGKKPKQKPFSFAAEARTLFDAKDIPQADNLARVRKLVEAIEAGVTTPSGFVEATGFSERHIAYNRRAAVIIGLLDERDGEWVVSAAGKRVLQSEPDSAEERARFLEAILGSKALAPFRTFFEAPEPMSADKLGFRIGQMTGLAQSTAERRASCLVSWWRYLRAPLTETTSEDHAEVAAKIKMQIDAQNAKAIEDYLHQLQTMKPTLFEKLVGRLIEAMSYRDVKHVGGRGDGGVDVRAVRHDPNWGGSHRVVIQAKRYKKTVGRRYVHELIGVMDTEKCEEALLITTGIFTPDAKDAAAQKPKLRLVDGHELVHRLVDHGVGMRRNEIGAIVPVDQKTAHKAK